jgi:hypothetical protein
MSETKLETGAEEAKVADEEASRPVSGQQYVYLHCVKIRGKLRVRILTTGYINDANVQFPRAIRVEGMVYRVKREAVSFRRGGGRQRGKLFYSISKNDITCVDGKHGEYEQTMALLAYERQAIQEEKKGTVPIKVKVFDVNEQEEECSICMDAKKDTVFIQCGHFCSCSSCATKLDKCPICRSHITERVKRCDIRV